MKRRKKTAGFSLSETVIAVGIFAGVGAALVGLLGTGIETTSDALVETHVSMLVENVQAQLVLDPSWPGDGQAVFYDASGIEVTEEANAAYRLEFRPVDSNFTSDFLETFRVSIRHVERNAEVGVWTLQRARISNGIPQRISQR